MMTILLECQEYLRATHFLPRHGRIEIVIKSRRQFTSVDSSIVKGPIILRDPQRHKVL